MIPVRSRVDPDQNSGNDSNHECAYDEFECCRQPGRDIGENRVVCSNRNSKVSSQKICEVDVELNVDRPVQPEFFCRPLDLLCVGVSADPESGRVTWNHVGDYEGDEDYAEDYYERMRCST